MVRLRALAGTAGRQRRRPDRAAAGHSPHLGMAAARRRTPRQRARRLGRAMEHCRRRGGAARRVSSHGLAAAERVGNRLPTAAVGRLGQARCGPPSSAASARSAGAVLHRRALRGFSPCARKRECQRANAWLCGLLWLAHRLLAGRQRPHTPAAAGPLVARAVRDRKHRRRQPGPSAGRQAAQRAAVARAVGPISRSACVGL